MLLSFRKERQQLFVQIMVSFGGDLLARLMIPLQYTFYLLQQYLHNFAYPKTILSIKSMLDTFYAKIKIRRPEVLKKDFRLFHFMKGKSKKIMNGYFFISKIRLYILQKVKDHL